nr:GNAT family N-acetyltransferase [Aquabacterium terrae]
MAALRVAAMRESLEHLGRFDPERARRRLLDRFDAGCTRHVRTAQGRVGFVVLRERPDGHWLLDHLYIHPDAQGAGLGAAVLAALFAEADARQRDLHVGALRDSRSNHFYARHGFTLVEQQAWDNLYVRRAAAA